MREAIFDKTEAPWESICSGISLFIIGWALFGYLCALSVKAREKVDLIKVTQGMAFALGAINVYALVIYGH